MFRWWLAVVENKKPKQPFKAFKTALQSFQNSPSKPSKQPLKAFKTAPQSLQNSPSEPSKQPFEAFKTALQSLQNSPSKLKMLAVWKHTWLNHLQKFVKSKQTRKRLNEQKVNKKK